MPAQPQPTTTATTTRRTSGMQQQQANAVYGKQFPASTCTCLFLHILLCIAGTQLLIIH